MPMKFTFLMTTLLWLLSNMAYAAEENVRCESSNSQYRHCPISTNGKDVRIAKQLSSTRCIINDTWGYDSRGVWVDKGCRAVFAIAGTSRDDSRIAPNVPSRVGDNETFSLRSDNGKCLDIFGADFDARKNGGRVYLWDCHGGKNQRWWFENGALTNSGGKCLDVHRPDFDSRKNGGAIQVWDCNGAANQRWTLKRNNLVSNNGLCLDVSRADFDGRVNNGKVQLWKCSDADNQRWTKYEHSKDGRYDDTTEVKHINMFLVKDVRYWVDTNPAWAGVYYPLVGGQCPYGGSYSGGNCLIYRFSKDEDIRRGATYWVRTESGWAGVYYKQIKDNCPYGGRRVNDLCQILTFN